MTVYSWVRIQTEAKQLREVNLPLGHPVSLNMLLQSTCKSADLDQEMGKGKHAVKSSHGIMTGKCNKCNSLDLNSSNLIAISFLPSPVNPSQALAVKEK